MMGGRGRVVCVDIDVAPHPQKRTKWNNSNEVEDALKVL